MPPFPPLELAALYPQVDQGGGGASPAPGVKCHRAIQNLTGRGRLARELRPDAPCRGADRAGEIGELLAAGIAASERPPRRLTPDSERGLPRACPIVASYGARDRWPGVRKVPGIIEPALTAAGIDHDIKVYAGAGHGFLNDHDPEDLSRLDKVIGKLAAAEYHEPSARDARARIIAFFRAHLVDAPANA